ncbi:MAG: hypothetical protein EOP88_26135 [Verrucomicrobiaceae bacterium]|nr:MAG: hypothetical protein EOP88_26135 [Verrucomicrobiaceae bacterium]
MKIHPCCLSRTRRATGLVGLILSGIPLLLMPKCPLCVAAYVALFTGISVSTATAGQVRTGIIVLCAASVCTFCAISLIRIRHWRTRER